MSFKKGWVFLLLLSHVFFLLSFQDDINVRPVEKVERPRSKFEMSLKRDLIKEYPFEFKNAPKMPAPETSPESKCIPDKFIKQSFSTENPLLNMLPAATKAVVAAILFLKNIKQEIVWIKRMLNIKPPLTAEESMQIIDQSPYAQLIFHRIIHIHKYIEEINSDDLDKRIVARITLLNIQLPPPYDKKFKKAVRKLQKECTNSDGELIENGKLIRTRKIFSKFLKQALIKPEQFVKKIQKMKDPSKYKSKEGVVNSVNCEALELIKKEPGMPFPRLIKFCKKHLGEVIKDLYEHFVKKRLQRDFDSVELDPKSKKVDTSSLDAQTDLLLRKYYKEELERWVSPTKIEDELSRDETYRALDYLELQDALPEGYQFGLLDSFIQNTCKGIDNCTPEIAEIFFHASGVLKKYSELEFVKKNILDYKIISPRLHQAINYALAIKEKIIISNVQAICDEVLHNGILSLHSTDDDVKKIYEQEAYDLYRYLVDNKNSVVPNEIDASEKKDSVLQLFIETADAENCLLLLNDQESSGWKNDQVEVYWSKNDNIAIISEVSSGNCDEESIEQYSVEKNHEQQKEKEFSMTFDCFKKMIEIWSALRKKDVPEIYFIKIGRSQVVVRESLEESLCSQENDKKVVCFIEKNKPERKI